MSRKYTINTQKLAKFQSSPQLPIAIRNAIGDLDQAVTKNPTVLLEVINEKLTEDPDGIIFEEDVTSSQFGATAAAFLDKRIWLKPKQEAIMTTISQYLKVE